MRIRSGPIGSDKITVCTWRRIRRSLVSAVTNKRFYDSLTILNPYSFTEKLAETDSV